MQAQHTRALLAAARSLTVDPGPRSTARLLEILCKSTGADAAALLVHADHGNGLLDLSTGVGLDERAYDRVLELGDHPRLTTLASTADPIVFAPDDPRPDPWDQLVLDAPQASVHACAGVALRNEDGRLSGLLTLDAVSQGRFGSGVMPLLASFAALTSVALEHRRLGVHARRGAARDRPRLIGRSPTMAALRREIELVAASDLPVMIEGETGVGKELVAEAVHAASGRADAPLVRINCAALPLSLAESELFGHRRGAFTGANRDHRGAFAQADGGTILLDEVGELEPLMQAKLLRVVQTGELPILGDERVRRVDVRILAASNRDLEAEVAAGRFRADLWYRIAGYPLRVPSLRERGADVLALAEHFLEEAGARLGILEAELSAAAERSLLEHPWPGNVRELEHCIARACLRASARSPRVPVRVEPIDLGLTAVQPPAIASDDPRATASLAEAVDELRRSLIERAVAESDGNWAMAARRLQIDRSNLHRMAVRLKLK